MLKERAVRGKKRMKKWKRTEKVAIFGLWSYSLTGESKQKEDGDVSVRTVRG